MPTTRSGASRRSSPQPVERREAPDLDPRHDPGPDAARERLAAVASLEEAATEPLEIDAGHRIRVGTASWTDPTMTAPGVFYPREADTAEERLGYYASRFPVVEVDATYYALPSRRLSELWVERTPPDFVFDIKAHALLTGQPTETKRLPKAIREALPPELATKSRIYAKDLPDEVAEEVWTQFADGLAPLAESGQLEEAPPPRAAKSGNCGAARRTAPPAFLRRHRLRPAAAPRDRLAGHAARASVAEVRLLRPPPGVVERDAHDRALRFAYLRTAGVADENRLSSHSFPPLPSLTFSDTRRSIPLPIANGILPTIHALLHPPGSR